MRSDISATHLSTVTRERHVIRYITPSGRVSMTKWYEVHFKGEDRSAIVKIPGESESAVRDRTVVETYDPDSELRVQGMTVEKIVSIRRPW